MFFSPSTTSSFNKCWGSSGGHKTCLCSSHVISWCYPATALAICMQGSFTNFSVWWWEMNSLPQLSCSKGQNGRLWKIYPGFTSQPEPGSRPLFKQHMTINSCGENQLCGCQHEFPRHWLDVSVQNSVLMVMSHLSSYTENTSVLLQEDGEGWQGLLLGDCAGVTYSSCSWDVYGGQCLSCLVGDSAMTHLKARSHVPPLHRRKD